ncbi:unnamed protein product [Sphenostylis stenocarpa]|uniref:Uncharacterized protein n=1 Tax=Sphenostylis stenocarpa TaxID=92480 RepID=A0AA86VY76_9FABA|nr:unnamed protein product [Sphenostylis stenocarpa]
MATNSTFMCSKRIRFWNFGSKFFVIVSWPPHLGTHRFQMEKPTYIAVIPSVGFSHLAPILHFSKRLVELHPHFHVTCIVPSIGSLPTNSKAILQTLPPNVNPVLLPHRSTSMTFHKGFPLWPKSIKLCVSPCHRSIGP